MWWNLHVILLGLGYLFAMNLMAMSVLQAVHDVLQHILRHTRFRHALPDVDIVNGLLRGEKPGAWLYVALAHTVFAWMVHASNRPGLILFGRFSLVIAVLAGIGTLIDFNDLILCRRLERRLKLGEFAEPDKDEPRIGDDDLAPLVLDDHEDRS